MLFDVTVTLVLFGVLSRFTARRRALLRFKHRHVSTELDRTERPRNRSFKQARPKTR